MKKNNNRKLINILLLLILVIGIGYAYLTSNLSITGTTEIAGNSWNIHFENLNVKESSVTATTPATIQSNNVDITYSIKLEKPKDYYEFTVDVKNDGTLPGKVNISTLSGITSSAEPVIDYSINYNNGTPVNIGDILNAGAKRTIKVRVFYKDDISSTDLPSSNIILNLTYTLQYTQSDESVFDVGVLIEELKTENSTCFTKYTGQVTDQPGETVTASNVYFDKCSDKRNIIFGGFCWQIIRSTETGGLKVLYNGEAVEGKCESTREYQKGINGRDASSRELNGEYLYGSSFTYDTSTNMFTLEDTTTSTWSDSTYENLLDKYTCMSLNSTCDTIYLVGEYMSSTHAYVVKYTIDPLVYWINIRDPYNINSSSATMVGYMYNKSYTHSTSAPTSGAYFGSSINYTNGQYSLVNTSTTYDENHRYTCNLTNSSGTCSIIRYYFSTTNYISLNNGATIDSALIDMTSDSDINRRNSTVKSTIDNWYRNNLIDYTNMLEDTVYCNSRTIIDPENWPISGNIKFKNYNETTDLSCTNITDQFAVSNNKAKLTYPIAMLTDEERANINTPSLIGYGNVWWTLSPYSSPGYVLRINDSATRTGMSVGNQIGVRVVISISSNNIITSGTGTETDPWGIGAIL